MICKMLCYFDIAMSVNQTLKLKQFPHELYAAMVILIVVLCINDRAPGLLLSYCVLKTLSKYVNISTLRIRIRKSSSTPNIWDHLSTHIFCHIESCCLLRSGKSELARRNQLILFYRCLILQHWQYFIILHHYQNINSCLNRE